jgi:hypothetical protein
MSQIVQALQTLRLIISAVLVVAVTAWILTGVLSATGGDKCEYADWPDIGPCDSDQGYVWQGQCYDNDGCYYELESCCEIAY